MLSMSLLQIMLMMMVAAAVVEMMTSLGNTDLSMLAYCHCVLLMARE
jgi:hypothetical protein